MILGYAAGAAWHWRPAPSLPYLNAKGHIDSVGSRSGSIVRCALRRRELERVPIFLIASL